MCNVGGLWAGVATQAYLASTLIVVMARVNNLDYSPTPAQAYGIYAAIIVFGLGSTLISGVKFTRTLDSSMTWISVVGLGSIVITLLATAKPKASAVSPSYSRWSYRVHRLIQFLELCVHRRLQLLGLGLDGDSVVNRAFKFLVRLHRI